MFIMKNSPRDLQAPSAHRRETLPGDRKLVQFYNLGPQKFGSPRQKVWRQKHAKFEVI